MPSVLPLPLEVEKGSRKAAYVVFILQLAVILTIVIVLGVQVARLIDDPVVIMTRQNTSPDLPYVYLCPSQPKYFGFVSTTIHAGCAKDATVTSIPVSASGNSTFRIEPGCTLQPVTIKIMDRVTKTPVETPCVSFNVARVPGQVRWIYEFYLLFDAQRGGTSNQSRPFFGYNGVGSDLAPESAFVYLSDIGGQELVQNQYYLRKMSEIFSSDKLEVFEQQEIRLAPNIRSDFHVIKTIRNPRKGETTVRYPIDGTMVTYPIPALREAIGFLHGLPQSSLQNLTAVYVHAMINYDQLEFEEQDLVAIGVSLIGTYGGLFSLIGGLFFLFFTNIDQTPTMTLRTPWKKLPSLVKQGTLRGQARKGESTLSKEDASAAM